MNRLFVAKELRMVVCAVKPEILHCSKYILLVQGVGAASITWAAYSKKSFYRSRDTSSKVLNVCIYAYVKVTVEQTLLSRGDLVSINLNYKLFEIWLVRSQRCWNKLLQVTVCKNCTMFRPQWLRLLYRLFYFRPLSDDFISATAETM